MISIKCILFISVDNYSPFQLNQRSSLFRHVLMSSRLLLLRELVCVDDMPKSSVAISGTPEKKNEDVEMRQKEVWKDSHVWEKSTCRGWKLLRWRDKEKMGEKKRTSKAIIITVTHAEGAKWLKHRRGGDCVDIWSSANKLSGRAKRS